MGAVIRDVPAPGYFIREEIEARGWTQRDLAYVLGVSEQTVSHLLAGKRNIDADMAKVLGEAFDVAPEFFVNLQAAYYLSRAGTPDPSVGRRARLQSAYPVREMIRRGWLSDLPTELLEAQMARFFGVPSVDAIPQLIPHAAKKSDYDDHLPAQVAWLYRVRQIAREMVVPPYSEKSLREALPRLRTLMSAPEEARHVPRVLTECGIRFVIVESLPGADIDGVTTWLNDSSPVVGMSTLRDRIDNFWFVLWHELEHILNKHGQEIAKLDNLEGEKAGTGDDIPADERLANAKAGEACVPQLESFVARKYPYFYERDLLGLAAKLQVHPGIVAGQLRRRLNRWDLFSRYLVKIRHVVAPSAVVDGWGQVAPVNFS